ncbi:MAG: hypothetical protein AAGH40_13855, partial [Verrucomicrobiota bacterium]
LELDSRRINADQLFDRYDSLLVEFSTPNVVIATPDGSDYYLFTGIGNDGEITEVSLFAIDEDTGDRARAVFSVTLEDTYTVEEFRADNGMDLNGADDEADFSNNGVPNLIQFTVGFPDASQSAIPEADFDSEQLGLPRYEFDMSENRLKITYVEPTNEANAGVYSRLRESTDLSSWNTVSLLSENTLAIRTLETASGYTLYEITLPLDGFRKFYHLAAEYNR